MMMVCWRLEIYPAFVVTCQAPHLPTVCHPVPVPHNICTYIPHHSVPGYSCSCTTPQCASLFPHNIPHHDVPGYSGKLYLGYLPILAATNRGYLNRPWTRQVGTDQFMNRLSGSQTLEERPNHHRPKVYLVSVPTQKLHLENTARLNCIALPRIATGEQTREKTK